VKKIENLKIYRKQDGYMMNNNIEIIKVLNLEVVIEKKERS
jgi:hypothetical protein